VERVIQNGSLAVNPIEGDQMRQIGRYQLSVRKLLVIPVIVALSWWLAVQAIELSNQRDKFQELAALHEKEALSHQVVANSSIGDTITIQGHAADRRCNMIDRPISEAEILEAKGFRERAGRRAFYHQALGRKYAWAAWFPWLPVATDPPEPE
jgi:hypothetical protein